MKLRLTILTLVLVFALIWGAVGVYAQEVTPTAEDEPTPVETPVPDEQPVPEGVTSTVQAFLFAGGALAALGVLTFVFWQQGQNLKLVSKTIPPEVAQLIFRYGMTQALTTTEVWDDEALKEAAQQLGYEVVSDGRGGFTITASAMAVAQNVAAAEAYDRKQDR
jgi:hypothetical protein